MESTTDITNSPPVACDMSGAPDTPDQRIAEYLRLFSGSLASCERTGGGIRFRFFAGPGIEAWVRDLAERERACCPFLTSTVAATGQEIRWDIGTVDDPAARDILEGFYELAAATSLPRPTSPGPPG